MRKLQQQTDHSLPAIIELELRTTDAVLALGRDLFRGRFMATEIDPDWHIAQSVFDAGAFLQEAVNTDDLQQSLSRLLLKLQAVGYSNKCWHITRESCLIMKDRFIFHIHQPFDQGHYMALFH